MPLRLQGEGLARGGDPFQGRRGRPRTHRVRRGTADHRGDPQRVGRHRCLRERRHEGSQGAPRDALAPRMRDFLLRAPPRPDGPVPQLLRVLHQAGAGWRRPEPGQAAVGRRVRRVGVARAGRSDAGAARRSVHGGRDATAGLRRRRIDQARGPDPRRDVQGDAQRQGAIREAGEGDRRRGSRRGVRFVLASLGGRRRVSAPGVRSIQHEGTPRRGAATEHGAFRAG